LMNIAVVNQHNAGQNVVALLANKHWNDQDLNCENTDSSNRCQR
jgi:hypothetical protein